MQCCLFKKTVVDGAKSSIVRFRCKRAPVPEIIRISRKIVERSGFHAMHADKGGRICLFYLQEKHIAIQKVFEKPWYATVETHEMPNQQLYTWLEIVYRRLVRRICKHDVRVSSLDLCASLQHGARGLCAYMQNTVKDHKPPGHVKLRPIHSSSHYRFRNLGLYCANILSARTSRFGHLLSSAEEFVRVLSTKKFPPSCLLVHWDFDNFYMQGTPRQIASRIIGNCELRSIIHDALICLPTTQYVSAGSAGSNKMIRGTGQGFHLSVSVATSAFLHGVEFNSVCLCRPTFHQQHHILWYARYADNLFFVIEGLQCCRGPLDALENSSTYPGKVEAVSPFLCHF